MPGPYEIGEFAAAGCGIRVTAEAPALAASLRDYLACFPAGGDTEPGQDGHVVHVVTDHDVPPTAGKMPVTVLARAPVTQADRFSAFLRVTQGCAAALLGSGVALLHAGLAETRGRRVLLAGASGAGKSTASRRLPAPWRSLSDDASQVVFDGRDEVGAAPWPTMSRVAEDTCSERWACDDVAPLAAVFYLRHGSEDELRRMGGAEASGNLYVSMRQFYAIRLADETPRPWMVAPADLFAVAQKIARAVPTYELGHARRGRFWELMEQALEDGAAGA